MGLVTHDLFCSFIFTLLLQRYRCAKLMHMFLLDSCQWCSPLHWIGPNSLAWNDHKKSALNLHSSISVTDKVKSNEQKKSIATGPSMYVPNLMWLERSYLKMWPFGALWGIGPHNIGTPLVQDTNIFSHIELVWYEVLKIGRR